MALIDDIIKYREEISGYDLKLVQLENEKISIVNSSHPSYTKATLLKSINEEIIKYNNLKSRAELNLLNAQNELNRQISESPAQKIIAGGDLRRRIIIGILILSTLGLVFLLLKNLKVL